MPFDKQIKKRIAMQRNLEMMSLTYPSKNGRKF